MRKTRTLSAEDRAAVDLLLDAGAGGGGRGRVVKVTLGVPQARVTAASKLLALLEQMPALEPSADLVARTMRHVEANAVSTVTRASVATLTGVQLH